MTGTWTIWMRPLAGALAVAALALPARAQAAQDLFPTSSADSDCLSLAIYYEARSESDAGQRAVAQVVLNRVRDRHYPDDVCGVVFQGAERRTGCQFSFTCDGSMARLPEGGAWRRARQIAAEALAGQGDDRGGVGGATHYHTRAILPYWAGSLTQVATIGAHIFYTRPGRQAEPAPIPFARVEQVVLSATDEAPGGPAPATVRVHRAGASRAR